MNDLKYLQELIAQDYDETFDHCLHLPESAWCAECRPQIERRNALLRIVASLSAQPSPDAAQGSDEIARSLAADVVQSLSDAEPTERSMDGMELLKGTPCESMFVLDGDDIRKVAELALSNAFYDKVIFASKPAAQGSEHGGESVQAAWADCTVCGGSKQTPPCSTCNGRGKRLVAAHTVCTCKNGAAKNMARPCTSFDRSPTAGVKHCRLCGHYIDCPSQAHKAIAADRHNRPPQPVQGGAESVAEGAPTEPGVYAWVPTDGSPALVLVNRRPSQCSPGGVLNGHCIKPCEFYDGAPVESWGRSGKWKLLRPLQSALSHSSKGDEHE